MCDMCNGKTESEVLLDLGEKIRRNGYVLQGVEGGASEPSWVYTIGLLDHLDHPELTVAGRAANRRPRPGAGRRRRRGQGEMSQPCILRRTRAATPTSA